MHREASPVYEGGDMTAAIPASIDEVTAKWMSEATGWNVTALRNEIIGVGVGVASASIVHTSPEWVALRRSS